METLQVNSSVIQGTINEMTFSFALKGSRIVTGWRWETEGVTIPGGGAA